MQTIKNLHSVSSVYFFLLGAFYVLAVLALRNDLLSPWPLIGMRIFDTPFALIALMYGGTSLYLQMLPEPASPNEAPPAHSPWGLVIFAVSAALFATAVIINFALR